MALKWLINNTKKYIPVIVIVSVVNALYALISVLLALFCKGIIDSAVSGKSERMYSYAVAMAGVILLAFSIRILSNNLTEMVRVKLEILFRNNLVNTIARKEYARIGCYHSGEVMNRLFNDIQIVSDGFTTIVPGVVMLVTKGVCAVVVLFMLSPKFTIVLFLGGIIFVVATSLFRGKMKNLHKNVQEKSGIVRSFLQEMIESILIIKVFSSENKMLSKVTNLHDDYYKANIKKRRISIFAGAAVGIAFELAYMVALVIGAAGIIAGTMTYGTLTAVLQLVSQIQQPLMNISGYLPKYYSMLASIERIVEIENLPDEQCNADVCMNEVMGDIVKISARDIDFSYDRNTILSGVSFDVNIGDFIAITGISGGGKSTLFLLMMAAYKPENGEIGFELNDGKYIPVSKETRKAFAYVPQGNYLFSGTLRENVTFWKEDVNEEELQRALKIACVDEFLTNLPEGLETVIGERGFGLSEGQAQRIAIARAVLSNAPILLLDESTSALDEETELKVLKNIASLDGKTCFLVTHRRAAISFCNKHFIINNAKLIAE